MPSCQKCGKEYSRQNSLNRHMQNHNTGSNHACHTCNITFHRRDLLARHNKIHRSGQQQKPGSSSGSHSSNGRRRCHTACVRCRELRTKCDGQHPCQRCVDNRQDCEFSRGNGRMSQSLANSAVFMHNALSPQNETQNVDEGSSDVESGRDMAYDWHIDPSPPGQHQDEESGAFPSPTSLSEPTCSNGQIYQSEPCNSTSQSDALLLPDFQLSVDLTDNMYMDSVSGTTAWPWIHENLFLPADWSMGWPDDASGYPIQQVSDEAIGGDSAGRPSQMGSGDTSMGDLIPSTVSHFPRSMGEEQLLSHEQDHAEVPPLDRLNQDSE